MRLTLLTLAWQEYPIANHLKSSLVCCLYNILPCHTPWLNLQLRQLQSFETWVNKHPHKCQPASPSTTVFEFSIPFCHEVENVIHPERLISLSSRGWAAAALELIRVVHSGGQQSPFPIVNQNTLRVELEPGGWESGSVVLDKEPLIWEREDSG